MLDFMEYIQLAFAEATSWNRDNSYSALTATAECKLRAPVPDRWTDERSFARFPCPRKTPIPPIVAVDAAFCYCLHPRHRRPDRWLNILPLQHRSARRYSVAERADSPPQPRARLPTDSRARSPVTDLGLGRPRGSNTGHTAQRRRRYGAPAQGHSAARHAPPATTHDPQRAVSPAHLLNHAADSRSDVDTGPKPLAATQVLRTTCRAPRAAEPRHWSLLQ